MSTWEKIVLYVFGIIVLGMFGFIVYNQIQLSKRQDTINANLINQQSNIDNLTKTVATTVSKDDLNSFIKSSGENLAAIQADLDKLHADLVAVNKVSSVSSAQTQSGLPSTTQTPITTKPTTTGSTTTTPDNSVATTVPTINPDYLKNIQNLALTEKFANPTNTATPPISVPIGQVSFDAADPKTPWGTNIPQRNYSVTNSIAQDANKNNIVYSQMKINVDGKDYVIPITSQTLQAQPNPSKFILSPRVFLGVGGGVGIKTAVPGVEGVLTPTLGLSIMSIGKDNDVPSWSFLQLGAGYDAINKNFYAEIAPAAFNLGQAIAPNILHNLFVAPTVGITTDGSVVIGGAIKVGL